MRMTRTIQTLTFVGSLAVGIAVAVAPAAVLAASANGVNKPHPPVPPPATYTSAKYVGQPIVTEVRDHRHEGIRADIPDQRGSDRIRIRDHREDPVCLGHCSPFDILGGLF